MPVIELSAGNFKPQNGILLMNVQEPTLVFFRMHSCKGCREFDPVFHQLANQVQSVRYAIINIDSHRDVVRMSRATNTPITAVPFLVFYNQGRPHAKYVGKKQLPSLKSFISKIQSSLNTASYSSGAFMQETKVYAPEMEKPPNLRNIIKGQQQTDRYSLTTQQEDDEDKITVPKQVTPHNVPWESSYKKIGTVD